MSQVCNFFVTDERLLAREYAFRITVYSFQSVRRFIIVGLVIFVSSLTVPFREVTLERKCAMRYVQKNLFFSPATFLSDEGLMTRELCDCRTGFTPV